MTEQVNYFPSEGNNWPDPIFLTSGKCLLDWLGLCWTGPVLAKQSGPKIWPIKSVISTKWWSIKIEEIL
jgi:hypothetical protein